MNLPLITLAGHVCIDRNTTEHASYTSWGSSVLYIAQYLRQAHDLRAPVITNYGPDLLPYLPDVRLLPATPTQPHTLLYENDTSVAPRIWRAHNTEVAGPPALTPEIVSVLRATDILIVGTLLPNYSAAYLQDLIGHLRPDCLRVLCPQGYLRHVQDDGLVVSRDFSEAEGIVGLFDLVVYSEEDHPKARQLAQEWLHSLKSRTCFVVTQGADGASIVEAETTEHIPTTPIPKEEITDSVGCGDVFAGALTYAYYETKDLSRAVRTAHQAAAKKLRNTPGSSS